MQAMKYSYARPNAAVGQSGLQALYETMFRNYGIIVGQVLVTKSDFYNEETRTQLFSTLNELMALNIIPIINTNELVNFCLLIVLFYLFTYFFRQINCLFTFFSPVPSVHLPKKMKMWMEFLESRTMTAWQLEWQLKSMLIWPF